MADPRMFPIQTRARSHPSKGATIGEPIYMAAYEVYCHVCGPHPALIDLDGKYCRGGFGTCELIAYLYARGFPRAEWRQRVDEALMWTDIA